MTGRSVPAWLTEWEYAHRGLHGDNVPENTVAGAQAAIAAGMGLECDIQRSADDHPIVFHDWDLDRLTDGSGATADKTADQLEQLTLLGSDQHPVRLTRYLAQVDGRVPVLIEIKSKPGYDVVRTCLDVRDALQSYSGDHAVMSFDPRVARWFRKHSPATPAGLVMREDSYGYTQSAWSRRWALWLARPDFLAYHIAALPNRWVAGLRRKGLPILSWTVNSAETRARALEHVDALISEGEGLA